jgi:hypothetical protein
MSRRKIGQEELVFKARGVTRQSSLDELARCLVPAFAGAD